MKEDGLLSIKIKYIEDICDYGYDEVDMIVDHGGGGDGEAAQQQQLPPDNEDMNH